MSRESDGANKEDKLLSQALGVPTQNEAGEVGGKDREPAPAPAPVPADPPEEKRDQPKAEVPSEPGKTDEGSSAPELQVRSGDSTEGNLSGSAMKTQPFGILVKEEIQRLNLIRLPTSGSEEPRCFQPASYDLRLGAEYVLPRKGPHVSSCEADGMLTIAPFATVIVSTYESVALPAHVAGRFNLRIDHALEGLIVQMGTQVEPEYEGQLFALLHNISNQPKSLKFRDYDTRPFTIEFSYTSHPAPAEARKKKGKTLGNILPANYARGGVDLVLDDFRNAQDAMEEAQRKVSDLHKELTSNKLLWFTGIIFALILITASVFIPLALTKFSYDRNYLPLVNAEAIKALEPRSSVAITPREQFYAGRLAELKARRDYLRENSPESPELKSILKEIDDIIDFLKK